MKLLKTILISSVVTVTALNLSGCGSMQKNNGPLSLTTTKTLTEANPVKSTVFNRVQSIAVVYYGNTVENAGYSEHVRSVYNLMTKAAQEQITAAKKFKVIDRIAFEKVLNQVAPDFNVFTATEPEVRETFIKAGHKLGVHGIIDLRLSPMDNTPASIREQFKSMETVSAPMNLTLTMYRTRISQKLYQQNDVVNYTQGTISQSHTANMVNMAIKPLIDDMIAHY